MIEIDYYIDEINRFLRKRSRRRKNRTRREIVMRNRRILFCSILVVCCLISFWLGRKSVKVDSLASENDNIQVETSGISEYAEYSSTTLNDVGAVVDNVTTIEKKDVGTIVLDAGHGGIMAGAEYEGILEKNLDLAVSGKVAALLIEQGYTVAELRTTDEHISLSDRAYRTNRINNAEIFVSIHANSFEDDISIEGIVTYYHPKKEDDMDLAQSIQTGMVEATGAVDREINCDNFQVLREVNIPAVLVEMGYMTNHDELMRLNNDEYQDKLALGIVNGINEYFQSQE